MRGHDLFRYATVAACVLCYVTILLGGNVMASDSGLACPGWPSCQGTFFPNLAGGVAVEWGHRLAAFVLSMSIALFTALAIAYERRRPVLLRLSAAATSLVLAQALLGGLVVETELRASFVLFHFALATALFGFLLLLALLANWRDVPPRWVAWARAASEERPGVAAESRGVPSVPARRRQPTGAEPGG